MNEEQNQSVRYSEIVDDMNNESFETSSTKFLMTSQNEINSCKCKRMLFGSGIFVMFVSIVPIVAIFSSKKSLIKTVMNKNNSTVENANSLINSTNISMDGKSIDDVNNRIANFSTESIPSSETMDDVTNEITTFSSTICTSETENEGT